MTVATPTVGGGGAEAAAPSEFRQALKPRAIGPITANRSICARARGGVTARSEAVNRVFCSMVFMVLTGNTGPGRRLPAAHVGVSDVLQDAFEIDFAGTIPPVKKTCIQPAKDPENDG